MTDDLTQTNPSGSTTERPASDFTVHLTGTDDGPRTIDPSEVCSVAHGSIRRLIEIDGLAIGVVAGPGWIDGSFATDADITAFHLNDPGIVSWVRSIAQTSVVTDTISNQQVRDLMRNADISCALHIPLRIDGETIGFMAGIRRDGSGFTIHEQTCLEAIGAVLAFAVSSLRRIQDATHDIPTVPARDESLLSLLYTLASLVDRREESINPHSARVALISAAIAAEMRLPPQEVERIRIAAMIHDAGKIGVPEEILVKTSRLTREERTLLMTHPALGASIVQAHAADAELASLIRHHHEWYDGRGYPDGLAGDAIPIGAAIIGSAEAFDCITSDLPYQPARSTAIARAELIRGSGQQFHPDVVDAVLRILDDVEMSPSICLVDNPVATGQESSRPRLPLAVLHHFDNQPRETFRILYEIAHEIGTLPEFSRFVRQIAHIIGTEMSVAQCTIYLLDHASDTLITAGSYPDAIPPAGMSRGSEPLTDAIGDGQPLTLSEGDGRDGSYMVPLLTERGLIGAIVVDTPDGRRLRDSERHILNQVSGQIAAAVSVAQTHDDARRAAIIDAMTGAYNYRYLMERLGEELERDAPISLMLVDMDSLKSLNDVAGHLAGDGLLRATAASLIAGVRRSDIVARYGGDEFVVLMPRTPREDALAIAARLAAELNALPEARQFRGPGSRAASYGVSTAPEDGTTPTRLLEAADSRMYVMKRARGASDGSRGS